MKRAMKRGRTNDPTHFPFPMWSAGTLSEETSDENASVADTPCQDDESCQGSNVPILLTYDMIDFPSEFSNTPIVFPLPAPTRPAQLNVHLPLSCFSPRARSWVRRGLQREGTWWDDGGINLKAQFSNCQSHRPKRNNLSTNQNGR